eukprot:245202_1
MANKPNVYKILVIGDHNTGKTSIARRYVYKQFDEYSVEATIGMDIASKFVRVDGMVLKVQLWDIAGQDRFIGLAPTYYRHAVAAIIVIDITSASSLQNAKKWKADVDDKVFLRNGDNIPSVLFANKWDLIEENPKKRQVSDVQLEEFSHENNFIGWFSTSAKSGMNVKKGMNFTISKIIDNKKKLDGENPPDLKGNDANNVDLAARIEQPPNPKSGGCFSCGASRNSPNREAEAKNNVEVASSIDEEKTEDTHVLQIVNQNLREMLKDIQMKEDALIAESNKLEHECQQTALEHNELKKKYQQKILKFDHFSEWDCDAVIEWICSLENDRYRKYETKLSVSIKHENIKGKYLGDVDKSDLHRLGVTDFADKLSLISHIKQLVARQGDQGNEEIEGGDGTTYV